MTIRLEELEVYTLAEEIADSVWESTGRWESFTRDTVGKQLARSADSIGANIAEAYGRYSFLERIRFCYYARGSYMETRYWIRRVRMRNLLNAAQLQALDDKMSQLGPKLNAYINSIRAQRSSRSMVRETQIPNS